LHFSRFVIETAASGTVTGHGIEQEEEPAPHLFGFVHFAKGTPATKAIATDVGVVDLPIGIRVCFDVYVRSGETLDEVQVLHAAVIYVYIELVFHVCLTPFLLF
jgi:hypothetical protein